VLAKYAPPPAAQSDRAKPAPGPFAFGDADYVTRILESAGFDAVRCDAFEREAIVPPGALVDRDTIDALPLDADRRENAWRDLQAHGASLLGDDGMLHIRLAPQLFEARNPA
jgi:hypothetical protein